MQDGAQVAAVDACGGDADDLFIDAKRRRVYVELRRGGIRGRLRCAALSAHRAASPTVPGARTGLFFAPRDRCFMRAVSATAQRAGRHLALPTGARDSHAHWSKSVRDGPSPWRGRASGASRPFRCNIALRGEGTARIWRGFASACCRPICRDRLRHGASARGGALSLNRFRGPDARRRTVCAATDLRQAPAGRGRTEAATGLAFPGSSSTSCSLL